MDEAPALNRVLARAALLTLGDRVIALEPLRAAAAVSYYGDATVSATLGYAPRHG